MNEVANKSVTGLSNHLYKCQRSVLIKM